MSKFYELDLPVHDNVTNQWRVRIKKTVPTLYLVNGQTNVMILASFLDYDWNHFAFDTENDAHRAAYMYYDQHGEHYLHIAKWIDCMPRHGTIKVAPQTIESQIMEFE